MCNTILVIGDVNTGHLPYVCETENTDAWNNPNGAIRLQEILNAIVEAGYTGIRIEVLGKAPSGKYFWTVHRNLESPEGRLAEGLQEFAKCGNKLFSVNEALSILERVYREQGLQMPQKAYSQPTSGIANT